MQEGTAADDSSSPGELRVGQSVRIATGPLQGLIGRLESYAGSSERITVRLEHGPEGVKIIVPIICIRQTGRRSF